LPVKDYLHYEVLLASNDLFPHTNYYRLLLEAPLAVGHHLDAVLEGKRQELCLMMKRLELMPSHLFLLRNILAAPRLMYLRITAPCTDIPILPLFDEVIRESLSAILNVDLDDNLWHQASLPVRWAVRGVVLLVPSATSTAKLTTTLLPMQLRDVLDSGIAAAMPTIPFQGSYIQNYKLWKIINYSS
jgi:hypothetical protein